MKNSAALKDAIEDLPRLRWMSDEDEAQVHRDHVKLLVLIAAGAAHPRELAAAAEHETVRQQAQGAIFVAKRAREAALQNPRLAHVTGRFVRHNPLAARRVALELIEGERQEHQALTLGIVAFGRVFGM
ncbi:MAG: hypothetical protein J0H27_08890 [Xanthomonadales bacterium]|nr:hypothetical protein [Xanthomonadales bacterium]